MENKRTPGPWVWTENGNKQYGEGKWLSSPSGMVLDYFGCGSHECSVGEADAMLIAAAPELLDALITAKARMEDMLREDDGQAFKEARKALPVIAAAIAKATGAQ